MANKIGYLLVLIGSIITLLIELLNSFLFGFTAILAMEFNIVFLNAILSLVGLALAGLMLSGSFILKGKTKKAIKLLLIASIFSLIIYRGWFIGPLLVLIGAIIYWRALKKAAPVS